MNAASTRRWVRSSLLAAAALITHGVHAEEELESRYRASQEALARGRPDEAILELESLADRGVIHPDASFMRGLAYADRAKNGGDLGDLGRAAAGFEEASRLRGGDEEALAALDAIREEVVRRRSKLDQRDSIVRPSPVSALLALLTPNTWATFAVAASFAVLLGYLLRRSPRRFLRILGTVILPIASVALLVLAPATFASRHAEATRAYAVVVNADAALVDDKGKPVDAPSVPEAALVILGPRRGDQVRVTYGTFEGWLPRTHLRPLILR